MGNWGQFEQISTQPAGKGATVEFRFRNGTAVDFTAHEIKIDKFLDDLKAYLKSNPRRGQLGKDRLRQHRLSSCGKEPAAISRPAGRPVANGTEAPGKSFRPPHHSDHAAIEARGVSGRSQNEGRQYQLHRLLGRRHGHSEKAHGRQNFLLRRRRRNRQAGGQGQRRILRLATKADPKRPIRKYWSRISPNIPTPTAR